jgi:hypothetical protein
MKTTNGRVTSFDNNTGHYTSSCECIEWSLQQGSDVFLREGVRISLKSWKDLGGKWPVAGMSTYGTLRRVGLDELRGTVASDG